MEDIQNNRFIVKAKPNSRTSEAYQTLRTNIDFLASEQKLNSIMITTPVPQKGIHISIVNLALTFALNGKKVIIIDCDLRMPMIHKVFGSEIKPGLTNALIVDIEFIEIIKKADAVHTNLFYITSGPIPPNPSRLFSSGKMKTVIEGLKKKVDIILLYAPPVIGFTDSLQLAKLVDGTILFLNSGKVDQDVANQAKELLENMKANILGVVLNQVNLTNEDYYRFLRRYNYGKYYN